MSLRPGIFTLALAAVIVSPASGLLAQNSVPVQPLDLNRSLGSLVVSLSDQPSTHTGFVFDRSMLQAASAILESQGMDAKRAAAALSSVSYDNYRYSQPASYSPEAMSQIVGAYRAAGWQHLVDARQRHNVNAESNGNPGQITDLWLHLSGADIDGVTVLTRGVRNVNLVQVACDLRPLDLIHLSGHFGIPKVDPGAIMVPDSDK